MTPGGPTGQRIQDVVAAATAAARRLPLVITPSPAAVAGLRLGERLVNVSIVRKVKK